ncbi:HEAT repeat domain-containing protein [Bremerella sp. JC770]|uniref:HEAT repeat domain-containing protein n=1 Tax=Bremerella sp. JC770 TaxID=3232137 RepID=UPI00345A1906
MLKSTTLDLRSHLFAAFLIVSILLGVVGELWAQPPSSSAASGEALIAQLGDEQYQVREQAERKIMQRGAPMLPLLREAARSPDPEIRLRATALYRQMSDRVRKDNLRRFADMADDVDLPGWKRFQERHGDTPAIRKLYVSILKDEWDIVVALETQPQMMDYLLFQRANKIREDLYGPDHIQISEGTAAAMLHATSFEDIRITDPTMDQLKFLLTAPQVTTSLQDPESAGPLLGVFDQWLESNLKSGRFSQEMRFVVLTTCLREGIKSGKIVAKQMLDERASPIYQNGFGQFGAVNTTQQMMYAMLAIAKLGGKEDIEYLSTYLDDATEISLPTAQGDRFSTLLKDVALVAVLHISGEDPKEFGYPRISTDPNFLYNIRSIGFTTDEQREKAFQKWEKSQKAQPSEK